MTLTELALVPPVFWAVVLFLFGVVIGSFLDVVTFRLHTGKSLNDRSHCYSCGHLLAWFDLFPLISYLTLRGRCRYCSARITAHCLWVEVVTGLSFLMVWQYTEDMVTILILCTLVAALIVASVYDLFHMIIPDETVIISGVLALGLTSYLHLPNWEPIMYSVLSGAIAFIFFAGLWKYSKGRWIGFGDAKLAIPLGMLVGLSGLFSLVVLSFWIGAILSVIIISIPYWRNFIKTCTVRVGSLVSSKIQVKQEIKNSNRSITMKSEIPFAPFMVLAFVLVFFYSIDVLHLTSTVIEVFYAH